MPPTSLFVRPSRCGLIRFYRRIYGIAPIALASAGAVCYQLSLSANALAMYVMVSFFQLGLFWVLFFGFTVTVFVVEGEEVACDDP